MTQEEWLASTDPAPMLEFLKGRASDRKLRLYAVACARQLWHHLTPKRTRDAIETAERYAEGLASLKELQKAYSLARQVASNADTRHGGRMLSNRTGPPLEVRRLYAAAEAAHVNIPYLMGRLRGFAADPECGPHCSSLLRDIVNPFAPALDPSWQTPTVLALAEAIYAERVYDRLPILADALEESGCADAGILSHCRGDGGHVLGCWVLDLVLGKV
jgi:hypothetical protein